MRWIKKEHSLKVSITERRSKGKLLQNFRRPLIQWSGKAWKIVATLWVSISFKSRWQTKWCTDMKELFSIVYRRPVSSKFREKNDVTFYRQQNKAHQILAACKLEKHLLYLNLT